MAPDGTSRYQLEFVMRAPIDSAQASELTTQLAAWLKLLSHVRFETNTRADADLTPGATPTIPRLLLIFPETNPATGVPWLSHALTGPPPPPWPVASKPGA